MDSGKCLRRDVYQPLGKCSCRTVANRSRSSIKQHYACSMSVPDYKDDMKRLLDDAYIWMKTWYCQRRIFSFLWN